MINDVTEILVAIYSIGLQSPNQLVTWLLGIINSSVYFSHIRTHCVYISIIH